MPHAFLITGLIGSALGLLFSAVSTYDFVAHLDRQVHGLHCSFLPGMTAPDVSGATGCHVTMMSPYSSLLREHIWGGIPVSLPAMAVFAFLLFWGLYLWLGERTRDPHATGFYALASGVPVVASLGMATVAWSELGAFCKLCVGIYLASGLTALGAFASYQRAQGGPLYSRQAQEREPLAWGALAVAFALGCLFVGSSALAYALQAPNFERYVGSCGHLANAGDPTRVLLALASKEPAARPPTSATQPARPQLLEVLDPLCPACRAFERRFERLALSQTAERRVLLFPLDNSCNWMVDHAIHPGACAISEALLCAEQRAGEVLAWAFAQQEELVAAERAAKGAAGRMVTAQFPWLASCVGSSKTRARLNRALRWAVDNQLPVLTPQLYVGGTRLCDADTDLGLDYMLTRLAARPPATAPNPPPLPGEVGAGDEPRAARSSERPASKPASGSPSAPSALHAPAIEPQEPGTEGANTADQRLPPPLPTPPSAAPGEPEAPPPGPPTPTPGEGQLQNPPPAPPPRAPELTPVPATPPSADAPSGSVAPSAAPVGGEG